VQRRPSPSAKLRRRNGNDHNQASCQLDETAQLLGAQRIMKRPAARGSRTRAQRGRNVQQICASQQIIDGRARDVV
jgi:hypothetical protein